MLQEEAFMLQTAFCSCPVSPVALFLSAFSVWTASFACHFLSQLDRAKYQQQRTWPSPSGQQQPNTTAEPRAP